MTSQDLSGWDWLSCSVPRAQDAYAPAFQDCFKTPAGVAVLKHLRQHFLERRAGPAASDSELRHLEGARHAIAYIERLAQFRATDRNDD